MPRKPKKKKYDYGKCPNNPLPLRKRNFPEIPPHVPNTTDRAILRHPAMSPFLSIQQAFGNRIDFAYLPKELITYAEYIKVKHKLMPGYEPIPIPDELEDHGAIFVLNNGSLKCAAAMIKAREAGYNVFSFNVWMHREKGHKILQAEWLAHKLGVPHVKQWLRSNGAIKGNFVPKVQICTAFAFIQMVKFGHIPVITTGCMPGDANEGTRTCKELASGLEAQTYCDGYFAQICPEYKRLDFLVSYEDCLRKVLEYDPSGELYKQIIPCTKYLHKRQMTPFYSVYDLNEQPKRCGKCKGCVIDYFYQVADDRVKPDLPYLAEIINIYVRKYARFAQQNLYTDLYPVLWHLEQEFPQEMSRKLYTLAYPYFK